MAPKIFLPKNQMQNVDGNADSTIPANQRQEIKGKKNTKSYIANTIVCPSLIKHH
jgi:hypothetical protein